jgi:hypothetical protein
MRFTLAPPAGPGLLGRALVSRGCARLVAGRDAAARATADFILLTLARHRGRQTTVAVYSAVAATIAIAGLSQGTPDLSALMRPRTAVLWVPLLVAYWMTLGLRASFLVPGETGAAWTFRFHSPSDVVWPAARAAIIGFVVPRALLVTALLVPLVGWRVAGRHAIAVAALTVLLSELVALTVRDIPFTRRTVIEQAKLNIRWAVYLPGMFFFAYVPVRLALAPGAPVTDSSLVAFVVGLVAGLEIVGRYRRRRRSDPLDETGDEDDEPRIAVLGLAGVTGS